MRLALTSATSGYNSHSKVESLTKLDVALHLLSRKCRKLHNFAQLPPASRSRCSKTTSSHNLNIIRRNVVQ